MKTEIFRFHDQTEISLFPYPEILIILFLIQYQKYEFVAVTNRQWSIVSNIYHLSDTFKSTLVRDNSIFSYDGVNGSFRDENDVMFSNKKSKSNKNS